MENTNKFFVNTTIFDPKKMFFSSFLIFFQKHLDIFQLMVYTLIRQLNIAELCKGSTTDSDSVCLGSNPSSAAKRKTPPKGGVFSFRKSNRIRTREGFSRE